MTCAELYSCDSTFKSLVDEWVEHRRCPIPLADRCLDFDLPAAAACAVWAANEPERETYRNRNVQSPIYPERNLKEDIELDWYWHASWHKWYEWANSVSTLNLKVPEHECRRQEHQTVADAILWLLDNWKEWP